MSQGLGDRRGDHGVGSRSRRSRCAIDESGELPHPIPLEQVEGPWRNIDLQRVGAHLETAVGDVVDPAVKRMMSSPAGLAAVLGKTQADRLGCLGEITRGAVFRRVEGGKVSHYPLSIF